MPNLDFTVKESGGQGGRTAVFGIRAIETEIQTVIKEILTQAVEEGERVAKSLAPRGKDSKNEGRRISDAIRVSNIEYRPGGLGGGGSYQVELIADGEIAPHLHDVFEGTANKGEGKIRPAHGNVFAIEKGGEGVHFREWVHGQKPQQEWWEEATRAAESEIRDKIQRFRIS